MVKVSFFVTYVWLRFVAWLCLRAFGWLPEEVNEWRRELHLTKDRNTVLRERAEDMQDMFFKAAAERSLALAEATKAEADAGMWGRKSDRLVDALEKVTQARTHNAAIAIALCALKVERCGTST